MTISKIDIIDSYGGIKIKIHHSGSFLTISAFPDYWNRITVEPRNLDHLIGSEFISFDSESVNGDKATFILFTRVNDNTNKPRITFNNELNGYYPMHVEIY